MGIKQKQPDYTVSKTKIAAKECSAKELTLLFSFRHLTSDDNHNFKCFEKSKKNSEMAKAIVSFIEKVKALSQSTWDMLNSAPKKGAIEYIPVPQFDKTFINSLGINLTKDDKLIVVRFNGQNSRFIMKRGTKCNRVAHILGIDYKMDLYKH